MKSRFAVILFGSISIGLMSCGERTGDPDSNLEIVEGGGGLYPSPMSTPTVGPPPTDPAATQAVNEAENLAPTSGQLSSKQAVPSPAPYSRTGSDVAELRVDEVPDSGSRTTIGSVSLLAAIGALLLIAAVYARKRGYLQSRSSQIAAVVVIGVLAAIVWLAPGIFPLL